MPRVVSADADGRRGELSAEDDQLVGAHPGPVGRAGPLDGGEQGLRGADPQAGRRRPAGDRLPLLLRTLQPGVPQPDAEELEARDGRQQDPVLRGLFIFFFYFFFFW